MLSYQRREVSFIRFSGDLERKIVSVLSAKCEDLSSKEKSVE